jgi:hypothetical protein
MTRLVGRIFLGLATYFVLAMGALSVAVILLTFAIR